MRRILVTGGSGFIGTHLVRLLRDRGMHVRILDLAGTPSEDVLDPIALGSAITDADVVVHLAAKVSVPWCDAHPEESNRINVGGTRAVIEASLAQKRRPKVVFASSAAVYGGAGREGQAILESTPLPPPLSAYAAQKRESEEALRVAHAQHGLAALNLRFFNVYGEGQDPKSPYSGVITQFLDRIRAGKDLELHGGGMATRDFVSVHDLVRGIVSAIELDPARCQGQAVNLGTGHALTIRALAEMLAELARERGMRVPKISAVSERAGDVPHSCASVALARELLAYRPERDLRIELGRLLG